jgi:murein DD-endopeptidase MepM/ murein hydrolase activator NlpD
MYFFICKRIASLKPKFGSTILSMFTNRYLTHLGILVLTFIFATSNIYAYGSSEEEFASDSLLYLMVEHEDLGYLIEEKIDLTGEDTASNKLFSGTLSGSTSPLTREKDDELRRESVSLTQGGTAVVKPNISGQEEEIRRDPVEYIVQTGDTAYGIADQFEVSVSTILWENNLTMNSYIKPGQKLLILPVSGIRHVVRRGDTISSIAKKYDADPEEIIVQNRLATGEDINIGQKLLIPGGRRIQIPVPVRWSPIQGVFDPGPSSSFAGNGQYIWPTTCKRVTQYFTWRHTGVDIACGNGVSVFAARGGVVVKASYAWNGGYGNMIIVEDDFGNQTLYGHNSKLYVSNGDRVVQGQVIAAMGSTGRSTGPHVHFEVRKAGKRINPFGYIKLK